MSLTDQDIIAAVSAPFTTAPPARLGVAVSGGGDSIALLHILTRCFQDQDVTLCAATVDHGLRPESAEEARRVARLCADLDVEHEVLQWADWDGSGNLQDQARRARIRLLSEWARRQGIHVVALGHTADDQAETVLMRLARSAGVNGLSAMSVRTTRDSITILRPMLGLTRADLRDYLTRNGLSWSDDPSNEDLRFDRIKARDALAVLAPLGITAQKLSEVASYMGQARDALDWHAFLAARSHVRVDGGSIVIDLRGFRTLPEEISRRLLVRSVQWINGAEYAPRRAALGDLVAALRDRRSVTLAGCRAVAQGSAIWLCRECEAVRHETAAPGSAWDGRWRVIGPDAGDQIEVRALGTEGLAQCDGWRAVGRPRPALTSTPAVWRGNLLLAAPLAGHPAGWEAEIIGGDESFFASLLSH